MWRLMRALVTGSSGFVGYHLVDELFARGHNVTQVDLVNGDDCMDFFAYARRGVPLGDFDVVYHCAAFVKGRSGIDGASAHLHSYNTMLDAAMFNWALKAKPGRVVYFSSSAAYPDEAQDGFFDEPLYEDMIDPQVLLERPEASYGMVKLYGEQMALSLTDAGVPTTVLRPFSGYSHTQDLDYPFPSFVARAKTHEDPFTIWGDGSQLRDWVHIDDIVELALLAATEGIDDTLNVCTGTGTSFTDLAIKMMDAAGYRANIVHDLDKPAGVAFRVGDPTRLNEYYTPKISLDEGIARAFAGS